MATDKETKKAEDISQHYEDVNLLYITLLAEQVADIQLGNTDVMAQKQVATDNLKKIRKEMKVAEKKTIKQTSILLNKEARKTYSQMANYYKAKGVKQVAFAKNRQMVNVLKSIDKITAGNFRNISNTTVMSVNYQRCIDKAILSVQSGASNYENAINQAIRQATKNGNKVRYASGRTRRLDTAVRMNVLDGVRQVQMEMERIAGEEFGADGVEIDAHALCAPDHLEVQGQTYTNEEFEELQSDLDRPIGEYNCQHEAHPIVIGVSKPAYNEDELDDMRAFSEEPLDELGGMSRYDASQRMRQMETSVREDKEQLLQAETRAKLTGSDKDKKEAMRYERRIAKTKARYTTLSKKASLKPQYSRMNIH